MKAQKIVVIGGSAASVWDKIQHGQSPNFRDSRSPEEDEETHLGIGEHLIPIVALRSRLAHSRR